MAAKKPTRKQRKELRGKIERAEARGLPAVERPAVPTKTKSAAPSVDFRAQKKASEASSSDAREAAKGSSAAQLHAEKEESKLFRWGKIALIGAVVSTALFWGWQFFARSGAPVDAEVAPATAPLRPELPSELKGMEAVADEPTPSQRNEAGASANTGGAAGGGAAEEAAAAPAELNEASEADVAEPAPKLAPQPAQPAPKVQTPAGAGQAPAQAKPGVLPAKAPAATNQAPKLPAEPGDNPY